MLSPASANGFSFHRVQSLSRLVSRNSWAPFRFLPSCSAPWKVPPSILLGYQGAHLICFPSSLEVHSPTSSSVQRSKNSCFIYFAQFFFLFFMFSTWGQFWISYSLLAKSRSLPPSKDFRIKRPSKPKGGCHQHEDYSPWRGGEDTAVLWLYFALTLGSKSRVDDTCAIRMLRKLQGLWARRHLNDRTCKKNTKTAGLVMCSARLLDCGLLGSAWKRGRGGKPSMGKAIKRENRNMIMKPLSVWDCGGFFLFLKQVAMKPLLPSVSQTLFLCYIMCLQVSNTEFPWALSYVKPLVSVVTRLPAQGVE